MSKINTDPEAINEVLSRGVEKIYPNEDYLKKALSSGKRLRIYCGFDPSADALHIGNACTINKLSQFQDLGHEIIFLIGDFTGMIGDPTDKKAARQKLSRAEVKKNSSDYKKQASAYLNFSGPNKAIVKYNSQWNDKLNFRDIIELASNFTVQQMIQRDMFQERLKEAKPIYLHEFLYPLTQAYDSLAMDVDLEIGGNDQMFNMMCGRDLMRSIKNKEKSVLTLKLITDNDGKKMGKSEGNAVFLNLPPEEIYGRVMSWGDGTIISAMELATKIPTAEIENIKKNLKNGTNPKEAKIKLAHALVSLVHGETKANKAQEAFTLTFQKKEVPENITEFPCQESLLPILDILINSKLANSKSEAKRLIEQKGIKVISDDKVEVINNISAEIILEDGLIIQRGKRQFIKIKK
jgi:tyrosyl-tRNA synthetase